MSWIQAWKRKPYQLFIISESEIEAYKAKGFEVRRLDPSATGYWIFADASLARQEVSALELAHPDWADSLRKRLERAGLKFGD